MTIHLDAGTFDLATGLKLEQPGVVLEGVGREATKLAFKRRPATGDIDASGAITLAADNLTLQGFAIVDSNAAAVVGKNLDRLTLRDLGVRQSLGLRPAGPVMGVRIFSSRNVLLEKLDVRHAFVSGVQIATSEHVVVRDCLFTENSVGLEIENDYFVDVFDSVMTGNATGVMFLDMPSYPHTGGHAIRLFNNQIVDNNTPSAAPSFAASARRGTGVLTMGGQSDVHVFANRIAEHGHANLLIIALPWTIDNPAYEAVPNDITVRDNVFGRTGFTPMDKLAALAALGHPMADVVWDGATRFVAAGQVKTSEPLRLTLADNLKTDQQPVTFLSMRCEYANGGMVIAQPTRTPPPPARTAEPAPVSLPQDG